MKPFYLTLSNGASLKVIADSSVYHDGHPIISYTYSLFRNHSRTGLDVHANVMSDYVNHPDYLGFITFEDPGKLFTYTSHGDDPLSMEEAEETIEKISHIRNNPHLWPITNDI